VHRTEQTIWLWEVGRTRPLFDLLPEIARCLGCQIDDFFEEDGSDAD
jgi:DNA-binding XRE family transcriptional regulator